MMWAELKRMTSGLLSVSSEIWLKSGGWAESSVRSCSEAESDSLMDCVSQCSMIF